MSHQDVARSESTRGLWSSMRPWLIFYVLAMAVTLVLEAVFFLAVRPATALEELAKALGSRAFPPGQVAVALATPIILLIALPHLLWSLLGVKTSIWDVRAPTLLGVRLSDWPLRYRADTRDYVVICIDLAAWIGWTATAVGSAVVATRFLLDERLTRVLLEVAVAFLVAGGMLLSVGLALRQSQYYVKRVELAEYGVSVRKA